MVSDISEFSYGFALTSELLEAWGLSGLGAPIFPTQVSEGSEGGYDVKLPGDPVFLQFKRSDRLTTNRALDAPSYGLPYFRFQLPASRHSKQHQLLLDLEASPEFVLYAAPRFSKPEELSAAFTAGAVFKRSFLVAPSMIGAITDARPHSISFGLLPGCFTFRSEARIVEASTAEETLSVMRQVRESRQRSNSSLRDLGDKLVEIFVAHQEDTAQRQLANHLRQASENRSSMDYAQFAARTLFGCELLFLGP